MAARSGGIPSVVEHNANGLLFEPDDVEDFVATACSLRDHPENAQGLRERGLELAKQSFDWSVIVDAHERSFAQVLSERQCLLRHYSGKIPSVPGVTAQAEEQAALI